jgi:hypothetical protein
MPVLLHALAYHACCLFESLRQLTFSVYSCTGFTCRCYDSKPADEPFLARIASSDAFLRHGGPMRSANASARYRNAPAVP